MTRCPGPGAIIVRAHVIRETPAAAEVEERGPRSARSAEEMIRWFVEEHGPRSARSAEECGGVNFSICSGAMPGVL